MKIFTVLFVLLRVSLSYPTQAQQILYKNKSFTVTDQSVKQGVYTAKALSRTHLVSTYQSSGEQEPKQVLTFRIGINGQENKQDYGLTHTLNLYSTSGKVISPLFVPGQKDTLIQTYAQQESSAEGRLQVTFRVDMRPVFEAFSKKGYYEPGNSQRIHSKDFKGVYITGDAKAFNWNLAANANEQPFKLTDEDRDGIYEKTISFNSNPTKKPKETQVIGKEWKLTSDVSRFPGFESNQVLVDALYNLSLEEALRNIRPDSAFMAGEKWEGVWTRDISYSILLSLATIAPEEAKISLMKKVKDGYIIQDTGTGGSWPVSSDRVAWTLAAWEVYCVTGDKEWLKTAYAIIKYTLETDLQVVADPKTGLFRGESSFLDWREQSYPRWMEPKDIFESRCLSTNALYHRAFQILDKIASLLDEKRLIYGLTAEAIKNNINKYLWIPDRQYYGQYLYGRIYPTLSPRAETLGEALCVLFDIADRSRKTAIIRNTPVVDFGIPAIYPQIPGIAPYHTDAIWPFVGAYWTWAASYAQQGQAVEHGLASIYRQAALFLTNKENMLASTGDFSGTVINSDRQLWSVAGNLATVYRILFGMSFHADKLTFSPFIPRAYSGTKTLRNFTYRKANLTITIRGYGNRIQSVTLDGKRIGAAQIAGNLRGKHQLVINMSNNSLPTGNINLVNNHFSPETPQVKQSDGKLHWESVANTKEYHIYRNAKKIEVTSSPTFKLPADTTYMAYQVVAVGSKGFQSFMSEPVVVIPEQKIVIRELEGTRGYQKEHSGFSGNGYVTINTQSNLILPIAINVPSAGTYAIDFHYANGNGPINTDNKCAVRTLALKQQDIGTIVFPQRGDGNWTDWGFTNTVTVELTAGNQTFSLILRGSDKNMNGEINEALVDYMRLRKLD